MRPGVTSAMDAAGYFVGAHYLAPRNNPPICVLGSNSVAKTTWKSRFLQNQKGRHEPPASDWPRAYTHLDAGPTQKFTEIFFGSDASIGLEPVHSNIIPSANKKRRQLFWSWVEKKGSSAESVGECQYTRWMRGG